MQTCTRMIIWYFWKLKIRANCLFWRKIRTVFWFLKFSRSKMSSSNLAPNRIYFRKLITACFSRLACLRASFQEIPLFKLFWHFISQTPRKLLFSYLPTKKSIRHAEEIDKYRFSNLSGVPFEIYLIQNLAPNFQPDFKDIY